MVEFVEINGSSRPLTMELFKILYEAFKDKDAITIGSANLIIQLQRKQNTYTYAIKDDGKYVGIATIVYMQKIIRKAGVVALIEDVAIHKDVRGFGFGKQLIAYLVEKAKEKKCYKVILYCDCSNEKFYKKCGFRGSCTLMRMDLD